MSLPNVGQAAVNDDGHFTVPWRKWLAGVERTIAAGGINTTALAADIAAIATALGSPDGTVTNIPDQDALNVRFDGQNGIQIEGAVAGGRVSVIWRGGVSNLSDVDLTGLADTYALKWDAASSTWKPGAAGGVTDGDKGDVIVSGSGATWTIDAAAVTSTKIADANVTTTKLADNAVSYAKLQDVSAAARVLGRKTAGSGDPEECSLSEVLDFIGSAAQGDLLYRGASGWARLPAGSVGQVLTTQGAGANPSWGAVASGSGGAMSLVGSATISGAAATALTISGLSLDADSSYYMQLSLKNASAGSNTLSVQINGDTTTTNYGRAFVLGGLGAGANGGNNNSFDIAALSASEKVTGILHVFKDIDSYPRVHMVLQRASKTSLGSHVAQVTRENTANLTSISLVGSVASGLAIGSTIKVFKVA